jgi:hypothetical protein
VSFAVIVLGVAGLVAAGGLVALLGAGKRAEERDAARQLGLEPDAGTSGATRALFVVAALFVLLGCGVVALLLDGWGTGH